MITSSILYTIIFLGIFSVYNGAMEIDKSSPLLQNLDLKLQTHETRMLMTSQSNGQVNSNNDGSADSNDDYDIIDPKTLNEIDYSSYTRSCARMGCGYNYLSSKYYPYNISEFVNSNDKTYDVYTLQYTNTKQKNWISRDSPIIHTIQLYIYYMKDDIINIKFIDPKQKRWEMPHEEPYPHFDYQPQSNRDKSLFEVVVNHENFSIQIKNKITKRIIFDTTGYNFIYSDKYLEITTKLPSHNIYGLGERAFKFNLGPTGTYTLFNKDQPWLIETGNPGNGLYGSHPIYLQRDTKSKEFSIVYLRNSNAMDVKIHEGKALTFKVIGGIFDFVLFLGDKYPETVISKYHDYLGGWKLFPFWSFGYHQCKWGYQSAQELLNVIDNFNKNDIPLDAIWNDLDYMENKNDFTINVNEFPVNQINEIYTTKKKRWVPLIDAGIAVSELVKEFVNGIERNVYIRAKEDNKPLNASVWPGPVHFPDFFNPNTSEWWKDNFKQFRSKVPFSGIWLDMNEVANFCDGQCNWQRSCDGDYDRIPYCPGYTHLYEKTITMDALHYGGDDNTSIHEYNVHNLFGILQCKSTHEYLLTESNLTFILTRATSPGTGKYAAHWLGDNASTWEWLKNSIAGIFSFNLFGIPMTGADICGFHLTTTNELCLRWIQLGSLYPFARNHNHLDFPKQEPYAFGPKYTQQNKLSLKLRYSLLKYYYSLFIEKKGKGTIFRPVFFEFPYEDILYDIDKPYTEEQFMVGPAIMVTPVLKSGAENVLAYFPKEDWYNFHTGELIQSRYNDSQIHNIKAPLFAMIPLFIRGGYIIPTQRTENVLSTDDLDNFYNLIMAFTEIEYGISSLKIAKGKLMAIKNYNDENIVNKCMLKNCFLNINGTFELDYKNKMSSILIQFTADDETSLDLLERVGLYSITFYGIPYDFISHSIVYLNTRPIQKAYIHLSNDNYGILNMPNTFIKAGDVLIIQKYYNPIDY